MYVMLVVSLTEWRQQSPYAKEKDFVLPFLRESGRVPLSSRSFVCNHLCRAAIAAGVRVDDDQRFGLHNLGHSLRNGLVNKAKVDPKTVQSLLRHAKIQTTVGLYTQEIEKGR